MLAKGMLGMGIPPGVCPGPGGLAEWDGRSCRVFVGSESVLWMWCTGGLGCRGLSVIGA